MGIQSTIEESTAVFRPSIEARCGHRWNLDLRRSRGYWGTIIGALILTAMNSILTLLDMPESVRQTRGPSGALEEADSCA